MAQEYTVKRVSSNQPRAWNSPNPAHGTTYYITVQLEGHPRFVEIGKKKPDALSIGDKVYGDIIANPGFDVDKFKGAPRPDSNFGGGGGGGRSNYVDHHQDIKAEWAIGVAVGLLGNIEKALTPGQQSIIKNNAIYFHSLVDEIKGVDKPTPETNTESASSGFNNEDPGPTDNDAPVDIGDDPINLDDIPF